ncbi:MAG: hypothetical protein JW734_04425 [Candidatus Omnitrophica bacterium]|nr:hypothetical protein [Candidatus Omnitrophota bacterium]
MKKLGLCCLILFFLLIAVQSSQASIVLKVMAANPSKEQNQKVQMKAYLPKEVKPDDIIDMEDLKVAYDTQQGSYFVYGEYELTPGQTLEKNIELNDIWIMPQAELESLRAEAVKTAQLLENTTFKERADFLKESIENKLNEIIEKQKVGATNPEKHISQYRDNLKVLETVKQDLVVARSLLSQAKAMPSMAIWKMFLTVVIFLGIIGISFYIVWHKQLKTITTPTFEEQSEKETQTDQIQKRQAKSEKKTEAEGIEKIIKGEEESGS